MKVRIRYQQTLYRFLGFEQAGDWSLVVSWDRRRKGGMVTTFRSDSPELTEKNNASSEQMRLTYHASGQVNYHGWVSRGPAYFEPLGSISRPHLALVVSVPGASRLEPLTGEPSEHDTVLDLQETIGESRFTFGIWVCPRDSPAPPNTWFRLDYDVFSVLVVLQPPPQIPDELDNHFIYLGPDGPFGGRVQSKDAAMLAYHQRRVGSQELGIYPPNGEGVYTLFPSVEMRIVPRVNIQFRDPALRIEIIEERARPMMIPFRIFRGAQRITKADLREEILSIELDAEL